MDLISALLGSKAVVGTVAAIGLLGVLIVIHEFGHFLFAKIFGVGVERFSVGFGPRIFSVTYKGTEYRLAWFPLGGYVRMVGDDPFEEQPTTPNGDSLMQKAAWKRLLIAFAGPLFNLLLPIALFSGLYLAGAPEPTTLVGIVSDDSAAARAGIREGDKLLAVNGKEVTYFSELSDRLSQVEPGGTVPITVQRGQERLELPVTLKVDTVYNEWGEPMQRNVLGVSPTAARPIIGVDASPSSPAYQAGLRSGDRVVKLNGQPVAWQFELRTLLQNPDLQTLELEVLRGKEPLKFSVSRRMDPIPVEGAAETSMSMELLALQQPGAPWGLFAQELFIKEAVVGRPAAKAGLRAGDMLVSVNGRPIARWPDLKKSIEAPLGEKKQLQVLREGKIRVFEMVPETVTIRLPAGQSRQEGQIGIRPAESYERDEAPLQLSVAEALGRGVKETVAITLAGGRILWRVVTGEIPLADSLGGPISMVTLAAESAWISIFQYVRMMALLSVNLALVNLLPIPLLDGGHILFHLLEMLRGRPVSMRFREIAQQVGLIFLFMLMAFALANDVRMNWLR